MAETMEVRSVEQQVAVVYCDRCGAEIPTRRRGGGGLDRLEGTSLTARGAGKWTPLIPIEQASDSFHGHEFNAANVDICGGCTEELQDWFRRGPSNQEPEVPSLADLNRKIRE